ncbi:hypothetical protein Cabys_4132 [Caldithrix abyssi DSM 13497]|uniref:Uncharacterized protein n=1 Tax=Caldithrix abyssi DSM 13497 TaxID=880073 RepID=A0A1J1CDR3_CALAY|nr:hypothetical protein Cabys_4108 [Caldithrix abyssi DSM 13497]APF20877.1 hypothetical protein Cabys_4132 [Caldithrix abyssi DSM 13497]
MPDAGLFGILSSSRLTHFVQAFNRSLNQTPKRGRQFERVV